MADLDFLPMPPPFGRRDDDLAAIRHRTMPGTPNEGQNAQEPIMIGSSDDEDDDQLPVRARPARGTIADQRARLHHNRSGTPIPRANENGLRIMSPPPPLPHHMHLHHFHRRPDWPHPPNLQTIQQRILQSGLRAPDVWHRLIGHDRVGRLLGLVFGGDHQPGQGPGAVPSAQREEYDVRMTHARAKPRIGFSFDFAPDDEDEDMCGEGGEKKPAVRTRTTIIIPDSPPLRPVDRKGKGRMVEEDVLDLESDEWAELEQGTSGGGSSSASGSGTGSPPRKKRKVEGKKAVEIVEVLSDDEEDTDGAELTQEEEKVGPEEKVQTVLVCAMCRRPLRMGGDRLWALRCGHMIDSRCYRKLGERPIVPEEIVQLEPSPSAPTPVAAPSRGKKRGNASRGRGRGKGKGKAPVAPPAPSAPVPYVAETIEWSCPVLKCGRTHWSERVVTGATSVWQPVKDTGAVGVFV